MADVQVRLTDPQATLLEEIADPATTIASLTTTYAFALLDQGAVHWATVNRAIIARWSLRVLERIKRDAWRKAEARRG